MSCQQLTFFDFNGENKLAAESIEEREAIVRHHAKQGALFFVSTSGGSDSCAMAILIQSLVPASQIIYVHAHLGEVEHPGIIEHIKRFKPKSIPLYIVECETKNFVDMVLERMMWPSPRYRNCTSTLKTGPIDKLIRKVCAERKIRIAYNCIGLRSAESVPRSKRSPLFINSRLTLKSGKRVVYDFLPIFHYSKQETFEAIYQNNEVPFHVYETAYENGQVIRREGGNDRVSCQFCIMSNINDLQCGARRYPDSYAQMVALEKVTGHTMAFKTIKKKVVKVSLEEKTGIKADELAVQRWVNKLRARKLELEDAKQQSIEDKAKQQTLIPVTSVNGDTQTIAMPF